MRTRGAGGLLVGAALFRISTTLELGRGPAWVRNSMLRYITGQAAALLWIAVCVAAFVLAVTDRAPAPAPA